VYCDVDVLIVEMLDERLASSESRCSAGNAMGMGIVAVVVVVDREEVECCAAARSHILSHAELHIVMSNILELNCWVIGDEPHSEFEDGWLHEGGYPAQDGEFV